MELRQRVYNILYDYYNLMYEALHTKSKLDCDKIISRYFTDDQINSFMIKFGTHEHIVYINNSKLESMINDLNTLNPKLKKEYKKIC